MSLSSRYPYSLQLTFLKDGTTRHIYVYHDDPKVINNWYMAVRCAKLHRLQVAYPSASESDLVHLLTEDFAKEGWLWKTGPRQSDSYKKRWFTLDNRKLMYHEDPLDANPKGEIFIGNDSYCHLVYRHLRHIFFTFRSCLGWLQHQDWCLEWSERSRFFLFSDYA